MPRTGWPTHTRANNRLAAGASAQLERETRLNSTSSRERSRYELSRRTLPNPLLCTVCSLYCTRYCSLCCLPFQMGTQSLAGINAVHIMRSYVSIHLRVLSSVSRSRRAFTQSNRHVYSCNTFQGRPTLRGSHMDAAVSSHESTRCSQSSESDNGNNRLVLDSGTHRAERSALP